MEFNWNMNFRKLRFNPLNIGIRQDILDEQNSIYFNLNLDRNLALSKLNKVLVDNFSKEYDEDNGMWSEHLLLFSALSISHPNKIKSILEIGTFNGETAFILSKLFPNSKIVTIDLNNDNLKEVKEYSYAFDSSKSDFLSNRDKVLKLNQNIKFIQMNSLNLFNSNDKYDLIWIDGAHGFPFVAIDLSNALRMVNSDGFILCDDVYTSTTKNSMITDSMATFITLQKFQEAGQIKFYLVPKRLNKKVKYVAVVQLLSI
jgi:predicted O-methyltransferase YrrM